MKFRDLSKNTISILNEVLKNKDLIKMIYYNDKTPLKNEEVINSGSLINDLIFPTPFSGEVPKKELTNLRVFFPAGRVNKRVMLGSKVSFQIVIHKNLWNIRDREENQGLRPYEIMAEIVDQFEDKTICHMGVLHFSNFYYHHINSSWGVYTLEASMTTM